MVLEKYITIGLSPNFITYYKSLGYKIPEYTDKYGKTKFIKNAKIEVKFEDLPPKGSTKVLCQCDNCGITNYVSRHCIHSDKTYFCKKCAFKIFGTNEKLIKSNTGRKCSEETKRKISKLNIGKKRTEEVKKSISLKNTGFKHSEETKRKISENNWMKKHTGKLHPNYNSSLTDEERKKGHYETGIALWRKNVLKRDNNTCQKCGNSTKLCAHHLNNFANFKEQRTDINNGITLCQSCHIKIHKVFGKLTLKEHLINFLNESFHYE